MSALRDFIQAHPRLAVLIGAGVSTGSGIPDYRDEHLGRTGADPLLALKINQPCQEILSEFLAENT